MDLSELFSSGVNDIYRKLIPTNGRFLMESLLGNRAPITEKDFNPEEITALKDLYGKVKSNNDSAPERISKETLSREAYERQPKGDRSKLKEFEDGKYRLTPRPYEDYLQEREAQKASYLKNPNKTSIDYHNAYGFPAEAQNWTDSVKRSYTDPTYNLATTLGSFNVYDEGNKLHVKDDYNFDNGSFYGNMDKMSLSDIWNRGSGAPASLFEMLVSKYGPSFSRPVDFTLDK